MSSEILGGAEDVLKGNLGGAWDIKHGYAGAYTDLGIAKKFGGADAAYSLRDVGAMNGPVVRVRRESDNAEANFSADAVPFIADWVNRQTVKPLDIQTLQSGGRTGFFQLASAAYSLRSLGNRQATVTSSGDTDGNTSGKYVVQVRRSSDDAIKSFTADEVTDGTLLSFCNNIGTVGTAVNGTGSVPYDSFTANGNTGFSADNTGGSTASAGFPYLFKSGDVIKVSYTVTNFNSDSSLSPILRGTSGLSSTSALTSPLTQFTANGTYTETLRAGSNGTHLMFADGNTGSYTISNFKIVSHIREGFVRTWYDQSVTGQDATTGTPNANHATQSIPTNQPKIVTDGAVIVDSQGLPEIDFDGSEDISLVTGSFSLTQTYTSISVSHTDAGFTSQGVWSTAPSVSDQFNSVSFFRTDGGFALNSGTTLTTAGTKNYVVGQNHIQTNIVNGGSSSIFVDGATGATGNMGSNNPSGILILGMFRVSGANANLNGAIKELIMYNSDQTSNRGAYESNMADHYGITGVPTEDNNVNGFVSIWYDQVGSNNLVQTDTAKQPLIVDSGSLVLNSDGNKGISVERSDTRETKLDFTSGFTIADSHTFQYLEFKRTFIDVLLSANGGGNVRIGQQSGTNLQIRNGGIQTFAAGITVQNTPFLYTTFLAADGSASKVHINGVEKQNTVYPDRDANEPNFVQVGKAGGNTSTPMFTLSELLMYSSEQSNRADIETNMNSHYSIYT